MQSGAVAACGSFTAFMTALACAGIHRLTGYNPFALVANLVIPFGAVLCGMIAASGYYFGAVRFHAKPNWSTLVQVVAVAALSMLLCYYLEYVTFRMPDGRGITAVMTFWNYVDLATRNGRLMLGTSHDDLGPLGLAGYGLMFLEVLGFSLGGIVVCLMLFERPSCPECDLLLSKTKSDVKHFPDKNAFEWCYKNLYTSEFPKIVGLKARASTIVQGSISYRLTLYSCSGCGKHTLREQVCGHTGKTFKEIPSLRRTGRLPEGHDYVSMFR